jgi:23S rRNA (cytosine1962-C5)-methyltransferase
MGFKHTGLFPEQAANWDWFTDLIKNAGREIKLLNLFAYTGGASVAAAKAGAFVCHVDASKGMVARAKQNAALSDIPADRIRYIVDDCAKFVQREIRRGNRYDAVILDPPSFGRGPGGERWVIEESLDGLVELVCGVLSDDPLFVILNSYTTGLSPSTNGYVLNRHMKRFGGKVVSDELGLPVVASGIPLPCGAASRWTR